GVDPDSLVASGGSAILREAVDRALGGIEFFAHEVWSKARGNVDARARALEDAARLAAKVATPVKRDLIVGTLASAMQVDGGVIRSAIARAQHGGASAARRDSHPNAPDPEQSPAPAPEKPPSSEELELVALLADHPSLIATSEADKAFWLLTDARLQAMYSAA